MKMEHIECSETSAYKIQTPGNHPEENIQFTIVALFMTELNNLERDYREANYFKR
jgi:hypothetical protein